MDDKNFREVYLWWCEQFGLDPGIVEFDGDEDRPAYYGRCHQDEEPDEEQN